MGRQVGPYYILEDDETSAFVAQKIAEWTAEREREKSETKPELPADSLEKIAADFPWLFSDQKLKG